MSSPYTKAKAQLEAQGYQVGKTEHWNPFARIRVDLFGCIDLVALCPLRPLLAVQVTDSTHVSKRMDKSQALASQWVSTGNRFEVWGYYKRSKQPPRIMRMQQNGAWERTITE